MRSIVINIRGTGGSGKSTVVTRVVANYPDHLPSFAAGRKRPQNVMHTRPGTRALLVPGHYETACGGCDTLKTVDQVYQQLVTAVGLGINCLYEGIMVMDDVNRAVTLSKDCDFYVIALTTPVDDCVAAIKARRDARGDARPFNDGNTRQWAIRCERGLVRLMEAGVRVERLDRQAAYLRCCELLAGGAES